MVLPFIALQGRLGRKSPSAAIQAEVPVIFVAFDALAVGAGGDEPVEALLREPLTERRRRLDALELPLVADGGRFTRSHLSVAADVDALEAAFADSRARRNEGLMVKDPDSIYAPGPARPRLAEDEEGAGHDRLRRRRRGGRPRQASRRAVRLHLRRARHGARQAGQHRQGVQRPDRRRDRRDDALVRGPHDRPLRPLPPGRADRRRRDRLRRHRPLEPPRLGLLAALPADRPAAAGQDRRRDRHRRDRDRAVRGAPARRRAARDGRLEGARRPARPLSGRPAGPSGCPSPPSRRRRPRRPRGRAGSARRRAWPPRPRTRRSRPSAGRG